MPSMLRGLGTGLRRERLKLLIAATHPIQYHVPWFHALHEHPDVELDVVFSVLPTPSQQGKGFGVNFRWDIPMLDGYRWRVLKSHFRTPSLDGFFGNWLKDVESAIEDIRPDVLLLTGWQSLSLIQFLKAGIGAGLPVIVRGESNGLRKRRGALRMAHRVLLSTFSAYLAIGKANRAFYLGNGVRPDLIHDCPYFVENERFAIQRQALEPDRAKLREGWSIPRNSFCFLFAGKLEGKKRIIDLLEAFRLALAIDPAIHLLVAGDGAERSEAETSARTAGLPVTFAGFLNQTEIASAYVAADCLVLPSDFGETWGLVVNEAMVCGLPAIVSDRVGCGPDLVLEGVTGSIFPFGDRNALAERLVWFAKHRDRALLMGQNAAEHVKTYSVERAVAGTLQAVRAVLAAKSRPRSR